jgi:hypothetical protein
MTGPASGSARWRSPVMPGRRRDSARAAGPACCGVVRVGRYSLVGKLALLWSRACSSSGSWSGASSSRLGKPATRRRRCPRRAVLGGDRWPVMPGRRRDSARAADPACCGVVRVGRYSLVGKLALLWSRACSSSGSWSGLRPLDWGSLPRGDDGARVGQCSVAIAGQ